MPLRSAAIRGAIAAGVKCIEHGFLMDEATAKLIAEKGVWLSLQPLPEDLRLGFPVGSVQRAKADEVWPGISQDLRVGEEVQDQDGVGHRCAVLPRAGAAARGNSGLACPLVYPRRSARHGDIGPTPNCWRCPAKRNPYPGKLGVVEQGALADLLLVDGNPLDNINLIADPAKNFKIIMKDGIIYKNTADQVRGRLSSRRGVLSRLPSAG